MIEEYAWPGNVREMENCIKRAVIMAEGSQISVEDIGLSTSPKIKECINLRQVRDNAEYNAVVTALARVDGNMVKAAELLGVSRPTLYDVINRHGIVSKGGFKFEVNTLPILLYCIKTRWGDTSGGIKGG